MKYFTETKPGKIKLRDNEGRLFSVKKEDGLIRIREECDKFYEWYYTKNEAIELFQEAIDWIKTS